MKPILVKYFTRHIVFNVGIVWIALACLLMLFEFLRTAGDHALALAFVLAALKVPFVAMETLPFACVIGATLTMRRLVAEGEMTALRTAGLSPPRLVFYSFVAAAIFAAAYLVISETLLPAAADLTRSLKNEARHVGGLWLRHNNDFIRVRRVRAGGGMEDVTIYHTENGGLRAVTRADRADYADGGWMLRRVHVVGVGGGEDTPPRRLSQREWNLSLQPSSFAVFSQKSRDMSIAAATRAAGELSAAGQPNDELRKTLWRRYLTIPAVFLLVGASVWFIGGRGRRIAAALPPLAAAGVGGIYFVFREISVQFAAGADAPPVLALPLLLLAAFVIAGARR